jgi:3,4-dihydroxy-9,10-secoandrosta-1,3,5(10)-triene-9,17-dione 4,5-dioxygenase
MGEVTAFGYLGVTAPDLNEWQSFATDVLGLAIGPGTTSERLHLRMDERAWRISVEPGPGGIAFCGWEVPNATALGELAHVLDGAAVPYEYDEALAKERGVNGLLRCVDPGGNQLEFFYGAYIPQEAFVSPTGACFVTSNSGPGDMGFGHAVITFPDPEAARRFYCDTLDFKLSDTITFSAGTTQLKMLFTHVNPRHHSFAFMGIPGAPSSLNHFMLEVDSIDTVGRALDAVADRGIELQMTLGKHTNDHMVSFYVKTPSGFAVEYGTAGRRIDDNVWVTSNYDAASYWGHRFAAVPVNA